MEKLKEAWAEIMERVDWKLIITIMVAIVAVLFYLVGFVCAIALESAWWLLLWIVPVFALVFLMGVHLS